MCMCVCDVFMFVCVSVGICMHILHVHEGQRTTLPIGTCLPLFWGRGLLFTAACAKLANVWGFCCLWMSICFRSANILEG